MSRQRITLCERLKKTVLLVVLVPLSLVALLLFALHRLALYLLVWTLWVPKGKDTLFIYSNSPIWQEYMTQQVLPLVEDRAIVLNWSERARWRKCGLAQQVLYTFGGHREFNPMVILFQPLRRAKLFRFWSAFKDWKHGDTESLQRMKHELRMSL